MPAIGGQPSRGISGTSVNAERMVAMLNIAGDSAGMKKRPSALSIPIITTPSAIIVRKGSMMRVSSVVSSSLPGHQRILGREPPGQLRREPPCRGHAGQRDQRERVEHEVAETPGGGAAAGGQRAGERRDECGADRAFGEQVAEQVGDAERHVVGVHGVARAEQVGDDRLAPDGRARGSSWWPRRSGRRTGQDADVLIFGSAYHSEQRRPGSGHVCQGV